MEAFEFLRNRQLLSPDQSLHETAMPNYTWGDLIQLLDDYLKANSSQLEPLVSGQQLAEQFHKLYEGLAPQFGYETKEETKTFNPESNNGKLMIAVSEQILKWLFR